MKCNQSRPGFELAYFKVAVQHFRHYATETSHFGKSIAPERYIIYVNNFIDILVLCFLYLTWLECLPMARETWVQSQVASYQRLKKMVLDASLLNTQHYKVVIKSKVEQSRRRSSALPYTLKREHSDHPQLRSPTLLYLYLTYWILAHLKIDNVELSFEFLSYFIFEKYYDIALHFHA